MQRRTHSLIPALLTPALLASTLFAKPVVGQVVNPLPPIRTDSGLIAGQTLPSGVKAWLGIPFAKPPIGALRWRPPQPIRWEGVWNADRKMPECIQVLRPHRINHYFGEEATSENCLYMNIWAPPGASAASRLPVIVFIYGGGFTIGSSGILLYDGEPLAKRGAVFVNFNYRLGILGFLAHPQLTSEQGGHSGDYGFLDQNAALAWIHRNIAQFGGDPARVMLAGQSAGAGSVTAQIFSPLSRGLFESAFLSSGCNWSGPETTLAEGERTGLEIQKRLGAADIDAMRQIPADRILALQAENQVMASSPGVWVGGVIDGYFLPKSKTALLEARDFADVPLIATSNQEDIDYASSPLTHARSVSEYQAIARELFGENADAFLKRFPVRDAAEIPEVAGRAAREAGMQGSARQCAQLKARYGATATYIGLFSRRHPYVPGVEIADQNTATVGAYHTSDIPYWFGTLDALNHLRRTRNWTAADRRLSDEMMDVLIAFAGTGRPSTHAIHWPAWVPGDEKRLVIGATVTAQRLDVMRMDWLAVHPPARSAGSARARMSPRD